MRKKLNKINAVHIRDILQPMIHICHSRWDIHISAFDVLHIA